MTEVSPAAAVSPASEVAAPAPDRSTGQAAAAAQGVVPRGVVALVGTAAVVLAVAGMQQIAWLLGPVFLAMMLVIAVSPLQSALLRRGVPSWVSTIAILLVLYTVLLALAAVLVVSVAQLATLLPSYSDRATSLLDSVTARLAGYGVGTDQITNLVKQVDVGRVADLLTTVLSSLTSLTTTLVLVLTMMFFMGLDAAGFPNRITQIALVRPAVAQALTAFARGTRRYLVVSSVFGLICSVLDATALQLLSVPLPVLWAILAFITNYIPNIGFFIGLVPPALLALLAGGPREMLLTIAAYLAINVVIQTVIQPKFVGDVVGLSITVTFLATAFWAWVLGPLGALLAIPMTLLTKALLIDVDPSTRWLNLLIGTNSQVAAGQEPGGA
jgi:AI-2 transport protein TqsA